MGLSNLSTFALINQNIGDSALSVLNNRLRFASVNARFWVGSPVIQQPCIMIVTHMTPHEEGILSQQSSQV